MLDMLVARFGPAAREMRPVLEQIVEHEKLRELTKFLATCPDLDSCKSDWDPNLASGNDSQVG
jgi:hypothetical protein